MSKLSKAISKSKFKAQKHSDDDDESILHVELNPHGQVKLDLDQAPSSSSSSSSSHSSSTAGSPFYDLFSGLEKRLAGASGQLLIATKLLRHANIQHDATNSAVFQQQLKQAMEEAQISIDEIKAIHTRFLNVAKKPVDDQEEKATRRNLSSRVTADVESLYTQHAQIKQVVLHYFRSVLGQHHVTLPDDDDDDEGERTNLLDSRHAHEYVPTYQTQEYIGELDAHIQMLEEESRVRMEFMKQIESDVVQVHDMFQDMRDMVNEQQKMIDHIDDNISQTNSKTKDAMEQLLQAEEYQRKKRKKMCCLILLIGFCLLCIILLIWIVVG